MITKGMDFLTLLDHGEEDIQAILDLTKKMKSGIRGTPLKGRIIGLIFQKPSTRTRVSSEVAVQQLGGSAISLSWNELQLGRGETVADTGRVLSRYIDGVIARVLRQSDLEEMAEHASIPVVNALSDLCHPLQALADLFTIWEAKHRLAGIKVAYVGDGNNVCNSLILACSRMGLHVSVAAPTGYEPDDRFTKEARKEADRHHTSFEILDSPTAAVKNADVVYTDVITSMGQEKEQEQRRRIFLPTFQVTSELFRNASPSAIFMHPLPAHRGEEVTDEVIDGHRSVVWEQAGNRLHTLKALLQLIY